MADDRISATAVVDAAAEAISAVRTDSATHPAICGTGGARRHDLVPARPSDTTVRLSYDWSAAPDPIRAHMGFPPFSPKHLGNSPAHLAEQPAETASRVRE